MQMEYGLNRGILKLYSVILTLLISSLLSANSTLDFDLIKKGQENNNTLLVIGGIQGDEPGGFISASLLATHYEITEGSLWIVPNLNFYSIIKRSRGPYGDMNRKFAYLSKSDPEYKTIQRIKGYIGSDKVKLIVNLHDGSGFYRKNYEDKEHSPYKWGQCSIIDQKTIEIDKYSNLKEISSQVVEHVNANLLRAEDKYHTHNTKTREGDKEMEKTLTYFAINNSKAAFGNEASKNLPTHERAYYHLLALEKYMDLVGIKYKRNFKLTPNGVYHAINDDIYISLYDGKIKLPLSQIRDSLKYFPIKKDATVEFKASNPLLHIVKKGNIYTIHYGNRHLAKLKADYQEYDKSNNKVNFEVDGKVQAVSFGSIIDVENDFLVKDANSYRINVIGYKTTRDKETNIKIKKSQIAKRFSVDKKGQVYRVEYYHDKKFAGMILVKFKS